MRVALVVIALLLASTSFADDDDAYKIIVNPNNPVDSVDRDFIRNGYLKKATEWKSGETIHPVDLSTSFPARGRFTQQVIRKTPTQLRNFWNQQIFSGKGVPPPVVDSVSDVIAYVLSDKGAVAYIPASADPGKAKVVGIK